MSCGRHHDTPCSEVLSLTYVFIDGEIDEEHRMLVATHLTECPPCEGHFSIERRVQAMVRRCCETAAAPDSVRQRIVTELRQVTVLRVEGER